MAHRAEQMGSLFRAGCAGAAFASIALAALTGRAQVVERFAVDQRGGFALIGNTLAQDCALLVEPLVGELGACGAGAADSGSDVLWSVDAAGADALASTAVDPEEAASIAELVLPDGARVTRAELYWSARAGLGDAGLATLGRGAVATAVVADRTTSIEADGNAYYQSSADVTDLVRELGAGAYRLSGIDVADPGGLDDTALYAAWWMAVFYALDSEPFRHLGLFDGFALVTTEAPSSATLEGFELPAAGIEGVLGVVGFDGDASVDGDQLRFGAQVPLGENAALGVANNFFDGSRRASSGAAFSLAGDRPRLSGAAGSLSGFDLHEVDVSAELDPGQTSAEVTALTSSDRYFLSGLVLSVATTSPDLSLSNQSVRDVDGPPLRPGDELEYTISVENSGSGVAPFVTLSSTLPEEVSFVPGSLEIRAGANAGPLTDAADADQGEIERGAGEVLRVRLGQGAGAANGGRLAAGESSVVSYRVLLDADASGSITSQALIGVARAATSEALFTPTDSDLAVPGISATEIAVDDCALDADCAGGGRCDSSVSPWRCVGCLADADCAGLAPSCDAGGVCVCVSSGAELACDGRDDDCNGAIDEGLAGVACEVGAEACRAAGLTVCDGAGGVRCEAREGTVLPEACLDPCADGAAGAACSGAPVAGEGDVGSLPAGVDVGGQPLEPVGETPAGVGLGSPTPRAQNPAARGPVVPGVPRGSAESLGGGGGGCSLGRSSGTAFGASAWLGLGAALFAWRRRPRDRRGNCASESDSVESRRTPSAASALRRTN